MVALELDPEVRDVPEFVFKKLQAEPVGNDPVAQHASGLGPGLEEGHRVAALGKLGRTTQTGRSGAHHGDLLEPRCGLAQGFKADLPGMLDQESLDVADPDGPVCTLRPIQGDKTSAAFLFAEAVRRAQLAAGPAEDVVLLDGADGAGDVAEAQLADELGRPGVGRAALGAGRVMAEQAAVGLGDRLGQVQSFAHLLEMFCGVQGYPPHRATGFRYSKKWCGGICLRVMAVLQSHQG